MKRSLAPVALALAIGQSAPALAEEPPPAAPAATPSPKRAVPDYSGRGADRTTVGEVFLWVPRVILSPLYLVSEYVIRRPLAVAIPAAERIELPNKVYNFFTFGPEHKVGVAPVGFYDFDFNPSVGVYVFWNDAFFRGDDLHVHAEAWPSDWLAGSITQHIRLDSRLAAQLRVEATRRPDRVYYGIGPTSLQSSQSRYGKDTVDAGAWLDWRFWRGSRIKTGAGLRKESTYEGHFGADLGLSAQAATGAVTIPDGFGLGYSIEYNRLLAAVDTRASWPDPGSGVRLEVEAEQGNNVLSQPSGWVKYGASAGAFIDLNQHQRVIGLSATVLFADPLGNQPVPFTELVTLGGDGPMRGYFTGRLVDRSASTAAAHYLWPIGPWLNGTIEAAVGNVFDRHLEGFRPGLLRFSGAIGLSTSGLGDYPLELIVGCGSETFEHGGQIDSVRATLSANHGF